MNKRTNNALIHTILTNLKDVELSLFRLGSGTVTGNQITEICKSKLQVAFNLVQELQDQGSKND